MSKYPDHQVQALADLLKGRYLGERWGGPESDPALPFSGYWEDALAALEFLGIEPDLSPTITVTVELPRKEAEEFGREWDASVDDYAFSHHKASVRIAAAIQDALQ